MKRNEKIGSKISAVYSVGITICLTMALLLFISYIVAFIVGGALAEGICTFLRTWLTPSIYMLGTATAILGLVKIYICGEKYFVLGKENID